MDKLNKALNDMYNISKIPFKLNSEVRDIYMSPDFVANKTDAFKEFDINKERYTISVAKQDERILPMLTYCIKNKIYKVNNEKNKTIINLLEGNAVEEDELAINYPYLTKKFSMIIICMDNNIEDANELIKSVYEDQNITTVIYDDKLIILGDLTQIEDHAVSIRESLADSISNKVKICYCYIHKYSEISVQYNNFMKKISLLLKYNVNKDIIGERDLIFEEIVDSIDPSKKNELIKEFNKGFTKLDNEMIKTIEVFFNCGLNLSEGAKELFIHRNTLIYRLDKVEKVTGVDIRDFNKATLFKILFTLWKEDKKMK